MIIYFKCLCTTDQRLWAKNLRAAGHEVRVAKRNTKWKREIIKYGLKSPFIVEDEDKKIGRPLWKNSQY